MNTSFKCEACSNVFPISMDVCREVEGVTQDKSKKVTLTVVHCDSCGKDHVVQIDDAETKLYLGKLQSTMRDSAARVTSGKRKTQKQSAQMGNLTRLLKRKREKLAEELHGDTLYDFKTDKFLEL